MIRTITLALIPLLIAGPALAAGDEPVIGTWRNLRNTMHIETYHCGAAICGKVAWASAEAIADARRGGTANLVGTEILRDFSRDPSGKWRGRVFVPDLNKTFSGAITMVDANNIKAVGCLVGRILCKSKVLVRLG